MKPTIGIGHLNLIVPSTANTPAGSSQNTGAPNIFTQWVKTPPGSPSMQRWRLPFRFAGLATSCPKVETPSENIKVPLQTHPPGFAEISSTLKRSQPSQSSLAERQAVP